MKLRSFRVRIALLSAVLAGGALIGFGVISWWLIYQAKVSRLDAELKSQLIRLGAARTIEQPQLLETQLPQALGTDARTPIVMRVERADRSVIYQSEQWTPEFNLSTLWIIRPPRAPNQRPSNQPLDQVPPPMPRFETQRTSSGTWRVGAVTLPLTQAAIAVSLNAIDQEMTVIRDIFLVAIPAVLLIVAGGAWIIASSSLRSIRQLTGVIETVTASGLEQRVPIGTTEIEFAQLIQVFNQMLERLEHSFHQASRFSADAAHELKTPLAILQGELEQTLQQAELGSEAQQRMGHLLDEVRRLSGIVRKLLLLSLADAGQMALHRVEVDLSNLLFELLEDIELLAPDLEVQSSIAKDLWVLGDRDLLIQVLQNLVSNAIKYNLSDGWIRVMARQQGQLAVITISNKSKDILECDRTRIFDRFHRGDPSRNRKVEGIGLGLSLAQEIARAHHGNLQLEPAKTGETAFTLMLPLKETINRPPA